MQRVLRVWIIFLVFSTLLLGCLYAVSQQMYRHTANDPQISFAHDIAYQQSQNIVYTAKTPAPLANTEGPFIITFDTNKHVNASDILLDEQTPLPPPGVFDFAKTHGTDSITWEPREGIRIAAIVVADKNGYVLGGRSLKETEKRIENLGKMLFLAWLGTNTIMLLTLSILLPSKKK